MLTELKVGQHVRMADNAINRGDTAYSAQRNITLVVVRYDGAFTRVARLDGLYGNQYIGTSRLELVPQPPLNLEDMTVADRAEILEADFMNRAGGTPVTLQIFCNDGTWKDRPTGIDSVQKDIAYRIKPHLTAAEIERDAIKAEMDKLSKRLESLDVS